jgi:hypothetical protein
MFEPFRARYVRACSRSHYFHYMRPESDDEELQAYCHRVFSGRIRHRCIDQEVGCLLPRYRVIKEIRANLMLQWIRRRFPLVPVLFVIRHSCAVVLSRMELDWATDDDIAPMLAQPDLLDDFLAAKIDLIHGAATPEAKHAVVWCVNNLVPLTQFGPGELHTVFYEDLCLRPGEAVPAVCRVAGHSLPRRSIARSIVRREASRRRARS